MKKLINAKRITKATLKSFIRRNIENLHIETLSKFDGMTDGAIDINDGMRKVNKEEINLSGENRAEYNLGIDGLWIVGSGRDRFELINNDQYVGINIYNSCNECNLVIKKGQ